MSKAAALDAKAVQVHPAGHLSQSWEVRAPPGFAFADLFVPQAWAQVERIMRPRKGKCPAKNDLLRVISADGSYDATCTIREVSDTGYVLEYRHGRRPSPVAQVLHDLDGLPDTGSSAELKEQATTLRKRWAAAGISRDDIGSARRTFAKNNHPDTNAVNGQRMKTANAILDAALENLEAA
jgi:hypothetical protein